MKKLICSIAVVLCLTLLLCGSAFAAEENVFGGGASVSGNDITVQVNLQAKDVHAAQLTVRYDPEEVSLLSAELGASLTDSDITSIGTETAGEVAFGFASLDAVDTGAVLRLNFRRSANHDVVFTVDVAEYQVGDGDGVNTKGPRYEIRAYAYADAGSGSGTGSTGPAQNVSTVDKTQEDETTTETTATPNSTANGDAASAQVTGSMGSEIVRQAENNDSSSVVIAPKMSDDVTKAEVTVPGSTVSDLGDRTNADLRVETPVANVTIPNDALSELGKEGSVKVSAQIDDGQVTIDISAGGNSVSNMTGGIKAALPLKDGQVAVLVASDGTETIIPKSVVEDGVAYVLLDGSATVKVMDNTKGFDDVDSSDWFTDAVDFAASHDLFGGTSDTTFEPDTEMTRAMLTTVLWRLESKADASVDAAFPDVESDQWYSEGVAWASENEIVGGYDTGEFGTNDPITRQELAVMLVRYAQHLGVDTTASASLSDFTDGADTAGWAEDAVKWAVSADILSGSNGALDPTGFATRAQVATILLRFVTLLVK